MKAVDCLREPGDVARRESDKAVAVWHGEGDCWFVFPYVQKRDLHDIPGDDWQPLHPAGELEAEVERLTAFKLQDRDGRAVTQGALNALMCQNDRLTARVAELEEELRDQGWMDSMCCCTGDCDHDSAHECLAWIRSQLDERCNSIREILATAPLPTAGDEGDQGWLTPGRKILYAPSSDRYFVGRVRAKPHALSDGTPVVHLHEMEPAYAEYTGKSGDKAHSVYAAAVCNCQPYREAHPAPAEPDSPAEAPRKPECLDGVPAVLCECGEGEETHRWWAYGPIDKDGNVAIYSAEADECDFGLLSSFRPIHHDAAAVELRGRIERGGWGVSDAVTKWMNEAPPEARQLFQSIHVTNFFHDERRRSFQVPRSNDGAISKGAEQLFQECYETCDAIIKAVESWRN